jgi:CubicO group peptidase (beta-lactamase class C family)
MPAPTRRELLSSALMGLCLAPVDPPANTGNLPGKSWETRDPASLGLDPEKLAKLSNLVGGRGCVVRHGYLAYSWGNISTSKDVASASKAVISTLLLLALQDRLIKSVDAPVAIHEPRLRTLNNGKDAGITWRHLASQTSGYGLIENPGDAWAYNDYALALYFDTLINSVFRQSADSLLQQRLGSPLQWEDAYTFRPFHREDRDGRLAISVRDFARFGLLIMRKGNWNGNQLVNPALLKRALHSPVPATMPRTSGQEADMLPGQRTIGGGKNQGATGPGLYSFNWWVNGVDIRGNRLFRFAPPDTVVAAGHGGIRDLWIIPSKDLIVSWNDTRVEDHDESPSHPDTLCNQAAQLMANSARRR